MRNIVLVFTFLTATIMSSQEKSASIPYASIPEAPSEYNEFTVTARMIDGLGFRFYWATEGLTEEDLNYKVSDDGRTIGETIDHIYGLSMIILNSAKKIPNDNRVKKLRPSHSEMRPIVLKSLQEASVLIKNATDLNEHKIIFKGINGDRVFSFWNQINGPIEDAVWHTGQIVMLRRAAGNPFNSKVSLMSGKLRE